MFAWKCARQSAFLKCSPYVVTTAVVLSLHSLNNCLERYMKQSSDNAIWGIIIHAISNTIGTSQKTSVPSHFDLSLGLPAEPSRPLRLNGAVVSSPCPWLSTSGSRSIYPPNLPQNCSTVSSLTLPLACRISKGPGLLKAPEPLLEALLPHSCVALSDTIGTPATTIVEVYAPSFIPDCIIGRSLRPRQSPSKRAVNGVGHHPAALQIASLIFKDLCNNSIRPTCIRGSILTANKHCGHIQGKPVGGGLPGMVFTNTLADKSCVLGVDMRA